MPYLVKEGDPAPWFTGTTNALGGLADMALRDADAARRERLAIQSEQRQVADQQARMVQEQQFRQAMDATNFGQQKELAALSDQYVGRRQEADDARRVKAEEAQRMAKNAQDKADAESLQRFAESMGLLPSQSEMPAGMQGPAVPLPTLQRPDDVIAVARLRQQEDRAAAAAANTLRDDQRADRRLSLEEERIAATIQRAGGMTPETRALMIPALAAEYGWSPDEAARKIDLVANKLLAPSQVRPDQFVPKLEAKAAQSRVEDLQNRLQSLESDASKLAQAASFRKMTPMEYIAALERQIAEAQAEAERAKEPLRNGGKPAPAKTGGASSGRTDSPDPEAAAAVDAMLKALGG